MLLRRLAGKRDIRPLKLLASLAEPVKGYHRSEQGVTYSTLSPFTRFVDACAPEALAARAFQIKVDRFLETRDPKLAAELRATLERWQANHPLLLPLVAASPGLREIETLSLAAAGVSAAGLDALGILVSGTSADKTWLEAEARELDEAAKPKAHAELAIVAGVRKLVDACAAVK